VDHGVREQPATHLLRLFQRDLRILRGQVDQEQLRAMDCPEAFETEKREGLLDVVALGIRHAFPEADLYPDLDHSVALPRASAPTLLGLSGFGAEVVPQKAEPRGWTKNGVPGLEHLLDETLRRERADGGEDGAAGETSADHQRQESVEGRPTSEELHDRLLGRDKGLRKPHTAQHWKAHRVRIAVPGLDPFVKGRQEGGHREDLRPASRADSDRADASRLSNPRFDGFQAIAEIERVHAHGFEIRLQSAEAPEAQGPKRVAASHEDQPIVRQETEARQDVAFVEPDRRD